MDKFIIRKRKASQSTSHNEDSAIPAFNSIPRDESSESESDDCTAGNVQIKTSVKKYKTVVRKWNDDYIKYGFYMSNEEKVKNIPSPTCLVCPNTSLANQAMVPNKLSRHLISTHPTLQFIVVCDEKRNFHVTKLIKKNTVKCYQLL